jgi:protein dithiol oxidoreductase (disulfide-forming)
MKSLLTALLMLVSSIAIAEPQSGFEYMQTQQAIPTESPAKIEVVELFWYGCPHCHQLEPRLMAWVKKLPGDVVFRRVPGIARPDWTAGGRAFYAMEALGVAEKLHAPLFDAIHKQRSVKPNDDPALIDWITKQGGLDRKKVEEAYNSFSVNTKVMRATQLFRASGATGVPALIIDGKYLTSSSIAGGNEEALKVADYLIEKARKEKGAK